MDSSSQVSMLVGFINMVISLINTDSTNSISQARKHLSKFTKSHNLQSSVQNTFFSSLQQKLNNYPELSMNDLKEVKISFKTYNINSYKVVSEYILHFSIQRMDLKAYDKSSKCEKQQHNKLINTVNMLLEKQNIKNKKGGLTGFQILQLSVQKTKKQLFQPKVSNEYQQGRQLLSIRISQPAKTNQNTIMMEIHRKLSLQTNCTLSKKLSFQSKTKSIFSFYDEETDFTILSQNRQSFQHQLSELNIIEVQNFEQQQPDWILTEEDWKLQQFKSSLLQFEETASTFLQDNPLI